MNIVDAMKSGMEFRRKGWSVWHTTGMADHYPTSAILADDWEVRPVQLLLTEEDIRDHYKKALDECWATRSRSFGFGYVTGTDTPSHAEVLDKFLRSLGMVK